METNHVAVAKISVDGGTQMRAVINEETVEEYAERYRQDATMPPLVVFHDGEKYWLADGFHRLQALKRINRPNALCEIRSGQRRDAVLYACGANAGHGLRRTNADKRRAVETMLRDEEWCGWSDNSIARACGVSQPFVASVRLTSNDYKSPPAERLGADGRTTNTANIGKRPAREESPAPAPYREGTAPSKPAKEQCEFKSEPPIPKPLVPIVSEEDRKDTDAGAFVICNAADNAAVLFVRSLAKINGKLLTQERAEKLRTSIANLRMVLDDVEERLQ